MTRPPRAGLPPRGGIGLKPVHYRAVLESIDPASEGGAERAAAPAFVEVHPQNYAGAGGPPHRWLSAIAERLPLSFHSVGLSLGSADGLDAAELDSLALLCERYQPASVSDHLSWSGSIDDRYPDLLPMPYTAAALDHFVGEVGRAQDRLRRPILIENPSRYFAFAGDSMDEVEFIHALCQRAGCGVLLDLNNVEVSCTNLGLDANAYVDRIDPALVGEIHLAGHAVEQHADGPLLIDDHGSRVTDRTWQLFDRFVLRAGARPTLIEWDTDVPDYAVLIDEMARADQRLIVLSPDGKAA